MDFAGGKLNVLLRFDAVLPNFLGELAGEEVDSCLFVPDPGVVAVGISILEADWESEAIACGTRRVTSEGKSASESIPRWG